MACARHLWPLPFVQPKQTLHRDDFDLRYCDAWNASAVLCKDGVHATALRIVHLSGEPQLAVATKALESVPKMMLQNLAWTDDDDTGAGNTSLGEIRRWYVGGTHTSGGGIHVWSGGPEKPLLVVTGFHPGCVEQRPRWQGVCEFDGRLAVLRHRERLMLFARSNTGIGRRGAQVTTSTRWEGPWTPFQPVVFKGYEGDGLYFISVFRHPSSPDQLLGTMPIHGADGSCTAIAASRDGLHWTRPQTILAAQPRANGRTSAHPVSSFLAANSSHLKLAVQVDVWLDDVWWRYPHTKMSHIVHHDQLLPLQRAYGATSGRRSGFVVLHVPSARCRWPDGARAGSLVAL